MPTDDKKTIEQVKCGDHVHHEPSGEDWVVAYVDGDHLVCQGWPESRAKLSDCKLIYSCTKGQHIQSLLDCAKSSGSRAYHAKKELHKLGLRKDPPMTSADDAIVAKQQADIEQMKREVEMIKRVMKERGLLDEEKDK